MARVLLLEDYAPLRNAVIKTIRHQVDVVPFATIADAEAQIDEAWDGMIVDRKLPDGDGLAFAIRARKARPDADIVLFTAAEPEAVAKAAGKHGIVFASKPDGIELVKRMAANCRARAAAPRDSLLEALTRRAQASELSVREHEVVRHAIAGRTRAEASAWMGITPGRHRGLVTSLLRKTGHTRLPQLIASLSSVE